MHKWWSFSLCNILFPVEKKQYFKISGSSFYQNWILALTFSPLWKLPPRQLEPWFVLWSFFSQGCSLTLMEYCSHAWAGAISFYLDMQNWLCRTFGPTLVSSLETLGHHRNVASISLFCRYYFGKYSSKLNELLPLFYTCGRSTW